MKFHLAVALLLLCCVGCSETPDTLVTSSDYDETEMKAAIDRARSTVDTFINELATPTGEDHAVKVAVKDNDDIEHFWMNDVSFRDGEFQGTINNEPGLVTNIKIGQSYTVKKDEISDWMFMRDSKMHGNYTMRPLLKTMPEEESAAFKALLAEP